MRKFADGAARVAVSVMVSLAFLGLTPREMFAGTFLSGVAYGALLYGCSWAVALLLWSMGRDFLAYLREARR